MGTQIKGRHQFNYCFALLPIHIKSIDFNMFNLIVDRKSNHNRQTKYFYAITFPDQKGLRIWTYICHAQNTIISFIIHLFDIYPKCLIVKSYI